MLLKRGLWCLLLFCFFFPQAAWAQLPDTNRIESVDFPQLLETPVVKRKLFAKHRNTGKTKRIRPGAIVQVEFNNGGRIPVGKLQVISGEGIYVGTYSVTYDTLQRWEDYPDLLYPGLLLDSVAYVSFNDIKSLKFRNNWERQSDWSTVTYVTGIFAFVLPPATDLMLGTEISTSTAVLMGVGLPMAIFGFRWNRRLRQWRVYESAVWEWKVVDK